MRLDTLPAELHLLIADVSHRSDLFRLAQTSRRLREICHPCIWSSLTFRLAIDRPGDEATSHAFSLSTEGSIHLELNQLAQFLEQVQLGHLDSILRYIREVNVQDEMGTSLNLEQDHPFNDLIPLLAEKLESITVLRVNRIYNQASRVQPDLSSVGQFAQCVSNNTKASIRFRLHVNESGVGNVMGKDDTALFDNLVALVIACPEPLSILQNFWKRPFPTCLTDVNILPRYTERNFTSLFRYWFSNIKNLDMLWIPTPNVFDGGWWMPEYIRELLLVDHPHKVLSQEIHWCMETRCLRLRFAPDAIGQSLSLLRFPDCYVLDIDPTECDDLDQVGRNVAECISESEIMYLTIRCACEEVFRAFVPKEVGSRIEQLEIRGGFGNADYRDLALYSMLVKYFPKLSKLHIYPWIINVRDLEVRTIWDDAKPAEALRDLVLDNCFDEKLGSDQLGLQNIIH